MSSSSSRGGVIPSHYEIGTQVSTNFINDRTFACFAVVPNRKSNGEYVKRNCILVITDTSVVELTPFPHLIDSATVSEVHELEGLEKLKFKKGQQGGSVFMQWKGSKVSTFLMHDPMVCVELVKTKMSQLGMKGKSLRSAMFLENAMACLENCKSIEREFALAPSLRLVDEMMDLLRLSAEKFAEANEDEGYMHVISYIQSFLQRSDVTKLLDSCVQPKQLRQEQERNLKKEREEREEMQRVMMQKRHQPQQAEQQQQSPGAVAPTLNQSSDAQPTTSAPSQTAAAAIGRATTDLTSSCVVLENMHTLDCDSEEADQVIPNSKDNNNKNNKNSNKNDDATLSNQLLQENKKNADSSAEWSALVDDMDSDLMDLLNSFGDIASAADNATKKDSDTGGSGSGVGSAATSEDISAFDMKEFEEFFS